MSNVTPLIFSNETQTAADDAADGLVGLLRRELDASEARFEALAEAMPHIVWSTPPDGRPDYFNTRWYAYTGLAKGPEAAVDWTQLIHPDDAPAAARQWRRCLQTGESFSVEYRLREGLAGPWRWFLGRANPLRDADGAIIRWFGAATDIDEVVRAREALSDRGSELERLVDERTAALVEANIRLAAAAAERRDTETARRGVDALYAAYIDSTTDGVFVVSVEPDRRIAVETINNVVERALGIKRDAIRGVPFENVLPAATAERLVANLQLCVASAKSLRYEETIELTDAERVYEVTLTPVTSDGRLIRVVGSARDLTERRRAEEQLRQAQKMEVIGQLTGGVAHDFNNLLQVVKGNLDLLALDLQGKPGLPPSVERRVRDAMAGAERGAKLTRQLLAFSRRQPLAPKRVDVYDLVASMSEMLERTLGETIEVRILGEAPFWTALVDPAQLENAVLNLAINARDAMPDGGRLTISVRNEEDGEGAGWIAIFVSDTGAGMSAAVLSRVYEPFFSTKPEGRGTGLGLPQVQGFIEQSNGRMEIESAPGAGATVRLYLPGSDTPAASADAPPPDDVRGRGESILVVEDDDAVRRAVSDLLTALGYRVASAGSTLEAAALLAGDVAYDLLLSDVVMPGQPSPPELARTAQAARPGLKVLFMSGYAEDVIVHQGRIDADVNLIQKPYRKDELSLRLRRLLDDRPDLATAAEPATNDDVAPAAPRRVLLVEDEPLIAMSLVDLLGSFGYDVIEAKNAAEAQKAFRAAPDIDVVLTDLGLPDMDGEDLALWLREQRPDVPIVFSTGQADYAPAEALKAGGRVRVVTKPFNGLTLREALDASQA